MTKEAKLFNERYGIVVTKAAFKKVNIGDIAVDDLVGKPKKNWKEVLRRFFSNPVSLSASIIFIIILLLSIIIPYTTPFDETKSIVNKDGLGPEVNYIKNLPPYGTTVSALMKQDQLDFLDGKGISYEKVFEISSDRFEVIWSPWDYVEWFTDNHPEFTYSNISDISSVIGTDSNGVDIWTRMWGGTWNSFKLAIIVTLITTTIGSILGSWIGLYVGTIADILIMKTIEVYNSIPLPVWYAVILFILPPGQGALYAIFIITGWQAGLGTARLYMWRYVNSDFMKAAETMGVSKLGRILKHGLPNYLGILSFTLVGGITGTIIGESTLAFLGFSPSPSNASLGNVMEEARGAISGGTDRIWYLLAPSLLLFSISISLRMVSFGLNDALEPKFASRA